MVSKRWVVAACAALGVAPWAAAQEEGEESVLDPDASFWSGWDGSVDVGLTGSEGNTETTKFRTAIGLKKETDKYVNSAGLLYSVNRDDGDITENRFQADARRDWKFEDSPWRLFALGKLELDEFQAWDGRVSGFVGPGYVFIEDEKTFLMGRVGVGGAYEFGGEQPDDFTPEGLIGADFTHKLTERQSIFANVDFFPSLEDAGPYRVVAKAGWEIMVDPEVNMVLKAGIEDRYDSNPGGAKRNDLDYYLTIGWTF